MHSRLYHPVKLLPRNARWGTVDVTTGALNTYGQLMLALPSLTRSAAQAAVTAALAAGAIRPFQGSVLWLEINNRCMPG